MGTYRTRLFRRGDSTPIFDSGPLGTARPFYCGDFIGALPPGDYDLVIEDLAAPQWIVGAALVRPDDCAVDGGYAPPCCEPIHVTLEPCGGRHIFAVLHCDPAVGPCTTGWPWELPSP
jgi:hypothetical protein